jgi:hypothetical protein
MASAAILGATGSLALAQTAPNPSQGKYIAPASGGPAANNSNNSWGIAGNPSGSAAAGPNSVVFGTSSAIPEPGTIVIRLNGKIETSISAIYTSADVGRTAAGAYNGFKVNPVNVGSYARLYPGFDGKAANGLRYGASMELRQNFLAGNQSNVTTGGAATSPSANSSQQTVFVRRAFTYVASDQAGILRVGMGDGVIGLLDNGVFSSQNWDAGLGGFNGGDNQSLSPLGPVGIPFVFLTGAGAEYDNNKLVYMSPQFAGFDMAFQYAPNMGNGFQNTGLGVGCNQASANCLSLTTGNDATRWYNQVAVGARYQQTFGAVDVKFYGVYETAGKEQLATSAYFTPAQLKAGVAGASAQTVRYDNLSFYKFGAAVTAANITVAADYIGGAVNGQLAMRPTGGASTNAVVTGITYANGPLALGVEGALIDTQGDAGLVGVSQRREYEIAFGGKYTVAPGLTFIAEYMYTHRHQGGFDFANAARGATRDVQGQGVVIATSLTW